MIKDVNTIVIGGGCLGVAAAISTQRRLQKLNLGGDNKVCIIEKSLIGSGLTARHSGIVRAANSSPKAAKLANDSIECWKNLESIWGIKCDFEENGAIWIAVENSGNKNIKWENLSVSLNEIGIEFRQIDRNKVNEIYGKNIKLYEDEVYYYEPGAIQFDPSIVRNILYKALKINQIQTLENVSVDGFVREENGDIKTVLTSVGDINCKNVVNAAGAWSPSIFNSLGIVIPVSTEVVNVVNWLTSQMDNNSKMPIVADYRNLAYFRSWRDGEIHMHQPRHRNIKEIARIFSEYPLNIIPADFVNDPTNQSLGYAQIRIYEDIARKRFENFGTVVYGSGYRSYFDITPDLQFILGRDNTVNNLFHSLGSGQAFKYTPVFGEIIADCIVGEGRYVHDIDDFSISRFSNDYMEKFLKKVSGVDHSLEIDAASL